MAQDKKDIYDEESLLLPYIEKIIKIFNSIELCTKLNYQDFNIILYTDDNRRDSYQLAVTIKYGSYYFSIEYSQYDNMYRIYIFMSTYITKYVNVANYVNKCKCKVSPKNIKHIYFIILLDIMMLYSLNYNICKVFNNEG